MKDYKLGGGGEIRQLTALGAPCRYLPKYAYCPVSLQEQDCNGKVDSGCTR